MTDLEKVKLEINWNSLTEEQKTVLENLEFEDREIAHSVEWIAERKTEFDSKKDEFLKRFGNRKK